MITVASLLFCLCLAYNQGLSQKKCRYSEQSARLLRECHEQRRAGWFCFF